MPQANTQVREALQQQTMVAGTRDEQLAALQEEIKAAMHVPDVKERQAKLNILGARIEDLIQQGQQDTATIGENVRMLDAALNSIDLEVSGYEKYSEQEQGWIDEANKQLEDAKGAFFFKEKKVAAAEAALATATQRAETAKAKRLQNATVGESLYRYIEAATATRGQLVARHGSAVTQESILTEQLSLTEGELKGLTVEIVNLRGQVEDLERQKDDATAEVNRTDAGTEARRVAEEALRAVSGQLDIALAARDKALGNSTALEKFLGQTTGSLQTQRKLQRNLDILVQVIDTGLAKRVPLIEARLDTMKSVETLRAAKEVVRVGDEIDEANAAYAAMAANAADLFVTEYLEQQPDRIREMRQILKEQDQNAAENAKRIQELWTQYDEDYDKAA